MRALYLTHHFKEASQIELPIAERPLPTLQKGECLIEVHASGINPSDALGSIGYFAHAHLPRIPGRDFAGVVVKGSSAWIGKKVWGSGGAAGIDFDGAHAEFLALPEKALVEIPHSLPLLQASLQPLPYITAYYSLVSRARIQPKESVLVVGALGQVGRAAMSICRWKQANPIALVRGEENRKAAQDLGWEVSTDIRQLATFDVILNTIGNIDWEEHYLRLNRFGRMAIIAAPPGKRDVTFDLLDFYRANRELLGINSVDLDFVQNGHLLRELKPGFESGALVPLSLDPESLFSLEQAALAYQKVLLKGSGKRICLQIKQ